MDTDEIFARVLILFGTLALLYMMLLNVRTILNWEKRAFRYIDYKYLDDDKKVLQPKEFVEVT